MAKTEQDCSHRVHRRPRLDPGSGSEHPPGREVWPAERDWTLKADAGQEGRGGQETFVTPAGDLYVAVWSAPAKDTPETPEGVAAWVEQYCKLAGRSSCSGFDSYTVQFVVSIGDAPLMLVLLAGCTPTAPSANKARQIGSDQEAGVRWDAGNHVVHHSVEQSRDSKK